MSVTESKLDQINKRRKELEGNPNEVQRNTVVLIPSSSTAENIPSLQSFLQGHNDHTPEGL